MACLRVGLLCAWLVALAACDFPRDPQGTLDRVRGDTMRVGWVANPPWVIHEEGAPTGIEPALVREFARELGAEVEWLQGGESELMGALERFQLDLVIGGMTRQTPWGMRVALTSSYHTTPIAVGIPPSAAPFLDLDGVRVAVQTGTSTAAFLEEHDAVPIPVAELSHARGPVAAPEWELRELGMQPTEIILYREQHVMAVPPGENGWLVRLDRFLHARRGRIGEMIREYAPTEAS